MSHVTHLQFSAFNFQYYEAKRFSNEVFPG